MRDGGRRDSNPQPPADKRSNSNCSLGSPQRIMRRASKRPGQRSARHLPLRAPPVASHRSGPEVTLPAALDATNLARCTARQRAAQDPTYAPLRVRSRAQRETVEGETKYPYLAASRRVHYSTLTCLTASTCDAPPLTTEAM